MFNNAFAKKRVFVTGHTGFKGSWLCAWLLQLGCEITGYSLDVPTNPSHFEALGLHKHIHDVRGDIRDRNRLIETMREAKPDIVFHLAAQALVRKSYEDPVLTFESNALGTLNVLEAIRASETVRAAILITSDKCYRNDEWVYGYRESDHLGGHDPYSASKGCAELIANAYCKSFFGTDIPCCTVRAGNVIGGGDWAADRIVPDCARAYADGRTVSLRNPSATRPWQLVLEPLSGYLHLASSLLDAKKAPSLCGEAFNFGPPGDVIATVSDVVTMLATHWQGFSYACMPEESEKKEARLLKLCCDKALAMLNWTATLNFEETMRYTAHWYHSFYKGVCGNASKTLDLTQGQIASYANTALDRGKIWVK